MTEQFAITYLALRAQRLKWNLYDFQSRLLVLNPGQETMLEGNNQLHLIVESEEGILVESENGTYDTSNEDIIEQVEEHYGRITLINRSTRRKRIRFIQAIPREVVR